MKLEKLGLLLLLCMAFWGGSTATWLFMYYVPNSPLMIRDKAFNDTADDLIKLSYKYSDLEKKYKQLLDQQ